MLSRLKRCDPRLHIRFKLREEYHEQYDNHVRATPFDVRISLTELEGERTSTQISGASSKRTRSAMMSLRSGATQATSAAITPPAVETGHSVKIAQPGRSWIKSALIRPCRLP